MKLRLFGCVNDSIVDGPGLRYTIFVQGCYHNCLGCHNPESHDVNGGYLKDIEEILKEIDENPLLDGVTLSGGEPMLQVEALIELSKEIKKRNLNIVLYLSLIHILMSNCIKKCEIIAFDDLGPEAIRRLEVENMPLVVIIDSDGNDQYILGREDYLSTCK